MSCPYWKRGHERARLFMNCLWCFHAARAKLSSCNRDRMASTASNICYLALCRASLSIETIGFGIEEIPKQALNPRSITNHLRELGRMMAPLYKMQGTMMVWIRWLRMSYSLVPRTCRINCIQQKIETKNYPFWNWWWFSMNSVKEPGFFNCRKKMFIAIPLKRSQCYSIKVSLK